MVGEGDVLAVGHGRLEDILAGEAPETVVGGSVIGALGERHIYSQNAWYSAQDKDCPSKERLTS